MSGIKGSRKIFSSNKNSGAEPGKIFSSNRPPSRHNISSLLDTAGVGKKSSNSKAGHYGAQAGKGLKAVANKATAALPPAQQAALKAIQKGRIPTKDLRQVAKQAAEQAAKEVIKKAAVALMSNPIFWIVVGIILVILFIIFIIVSGGESQAIYQQQQQQQTNQLQITKTGPSQAKAGDTLQYKINVTYPGSADDIVISDPFPDGTTYVSSSPKGTVSGSGITWDAKKLNLDLTNPINITVSLTLKATKNNTNLYNVATANMTGGSLGRGGNVPGNHSTCNGKYTLTSPYANFGDPQCNFTVQQLGQEIKQMDPSNYYIWDCMASHESSYNPNAYLAASTSGYGAYGLYQMNPQGKGNGSYDDGTVNWPLQISNAINYNKKEIGGSFAYWATYAGCH